MWGSGVQPATNSFVILNSNFFLKNVNLNNKNPAKVVKGFFWDIQDWLHSSITPCLGSQIVSTLPQLHYITVHCKLVQFGAEQCSTMICCAEICCAVICCAVICCAVICCAVQLYAVRCRTVQCGSVQFSAVGSEECSAVNCTEIESQNLPRTEQ